VAVFANAAHLFMPPPIEYFELTENSAAAAVLPPGARYTPPRAERDFQYDIGARFIFRGHQIRINQWFKRQILFLDHGQLQLQSSANPDELINPNIFLPVNLDRGRAHGVEALLRTASRRGVSGWVNYSLNFAQAIGGVLYGYTDGSEPERNYFFLDHDQRHRVAAGIDYDMARWRTFVNLTYTYGSGFPDSSDGVFGVCVTRSCRLPQHSELSLTLGKRLGENLEARLEIENLTNNVYPLNIHSEFNGSHVSPPRLVTVRLTHRF
jgi:outer membrane receptor protein involved in Fe transport